MTKKRRYDFYLEDMLLSMDRIQEYIKDLNLTSFKKNTLVVDAVIRNLEIIGEASKNIPASIKKKHPLIPWQQMQGLRNRISHEYFGIDYEIIWKIIHDQMKENKQELERIIKELEKNSSD